MNNIIDCKGLNCPLPVVHTKKYFDTIEEGESVTIVDNEVAKNNVVKLAQSNGYENKVEEKEGLYYIKITKKKQETIFSERSKEKSFTLVVSSDKLGSGDDRLGETLMKGYIFALSEAEVIPKHLLFLNSGVKLTIQDSPVLESLQKLTERGTEILACGTCLDFYNIKEALAVGEITNMYTIVELMNGADNTIKV